MRKNLTVSGATVVVKDNQTGREQTVSASSEGTFTVSQLEFGTYTVTITATGYKTFTATGVKIDAGREYPLNALLEVGQVSEQVTVVAGAEQINSTNAELSTTISTQQVRELPLNGRSPLNLVNLQAGGNPNNNNINGQRTSSTTVTRDGLNIQDNYIRTGRVVSEAPSVDDTSEITVITQNAGVETGGGSSVVQLVTPRGGNEFHGNLFIFNRNSKFAANSFTNKQSGGTVPFLNRNQFGGSISGPVPIFNFGEGGPAFLKNRAFFFFNYENFIQRQQSSASATTLLPAARTGLYTYVGTDGATRTVNVLTGQGFDLSTAARQAAFSQAGGVLQIDSIIQSRLLDRLPTAGNGTLTGTNYLQTVNFLRTNGSDRETYTGRFDLDINDRNSFSATYKYADSATDLPTQPAGFSTQSYVQNINTTNFMAAAYRTTIGNNFSNEFRGGFSYAKPFFSESLDVPSDFIIAGLPFTNPEGSFRAQGRKTRYLNLQDNAVYTSGNHSFRFGGQLETFRFISTTNFGTIPTYTIAATNNPNTPGITSTSGLAPFANATDLARINALRYTLGGIVGSASLTANLVSPEAGYGFQPGRDVYQYEIYAGYFSDQWRVRPNLTLNLGVRYEYYTPLHTPNAIYLEPVITDPDNPGASLFAPGAVSDFVGGNAGKEGRFFRPDKNNLVPNVSFAYSPRFEKGVFSKLLSGNMVLRGGFRITNVNDEYAKAAATLTTSGLGSINTLAARANGSQNLRSNISGVNNQFEAVPGFTTPTYTAPPRLFSTNNAQANSLGFVFGTDPNFEVTQNYEYNFGIQRDLGLGMVGEVRYVGSFTNNATRTTDLNQIDLVGSGFLDDFKKAQNNCIAQGQTLLTGPNDTRNPRFICTSAAFNPAIAGSVQLPVLMGQIAGQGNLTNSTNLLFIQQGRVGSLAQNYINLRQQGTATLQPTSDIFIVELLGNEGRVRYNSLQAEIRRRFSKGFGFQVNYAFSKTLSDVLSDVNADQNRQAKLVDNNNPKINYGRPDYDRTHVMNANLVYELPFGRGKTFFDQGGIMNTIFGGFQISAIITAASGPPLGIIDPRATNGITTNAGRLSAQTSLSREELKALTGIFKTPNGTFFINPSVLYATATGSGLPALLGVDLTKPLPAGYTISSIRAANPIDQAPFPGQVFFYNNAGESGNLPINFLNGTPYYNVDLGISKNFKFGETMRLQLRAEAFNFLNSTVLFYGSDLDITGTNFGRITQAYTKRVIQFGARFDF